TSASLRRHGSKHRSGLRGRLAVNTAAAGYRGENSMTAYATAPYNFVRLPSAPVLVSAAPSDDSAESSVDEAGDRLSVTLPNGDRYHADRLTGTIELTLRALTPLFIAGQRIGDEN